MTKRRQPFQRIEIAHPDGTIAGWYSPATPSSPAQATTSGTPSGQDNLLFCHATGLCAAAYLPALRHVEARLSIWAIDMRGHGRTDLPTPAELKSWGLYVDDIVHALKHLQHQQPVASQWTLAGHSMGGVTSAIAAAALSGDTDSRSVQKVCLIEPVALPRTISFLAGTPLWPPIRKRFGMVVNAKRRRARFESVEAVRSSYRAKPFFTHWDAQCLEGYLQDGLRPVTSNHQPSAQVHRASNEPVQLTCDPSWEAATFGAQANPFWKAMGKISAQTSVYCASDKTSTVRPFAIRRLRSRGANVQILPERSHLFPMTHPADLAQIVNAVVAK